LSLRKEKEERGAGESFRNAIEKKGVTAHDLGRHYKGGMPSFSTPTRSGEERKGRSLFS